jgi:hypothetical protein
MALEYLRIEPRAKLPDIAAAKPFRAVVAIEESVAVEWQIAVSEWLVASGCLYMMAWGTECSSWDDSVDAAALEESGYHDIPEKRFVMTTWHEKETLAEVFWYSKNCANHPKVDLPNTLLVHIGGQEREAEFLRSYEAA